jgi:RHS repeat-associated protein
LSWWQTAIPWLRNNLIVRIDPGTSLYYLRGRYYNPVLGRFIRKDPFEGFAQLPSTLNRFIYALDNPANRGQ